MYDAVNSDKRPPMPTYAQVIGAVSTVINLPAVPEVTSVADGMVSANVANALVKSKSYKLDGTLGLTKYIKNPGPIAKISSSTIKAIGILAAASFTIGVADNFANYENAWERTYVDVGAFALGVGAGALIGTLGLPAVGAVAAGMFAGAFISYIGSEIKDKYYYKSKRRN